MALGITGIIAAYIILGLLLLSINLYSKWSWPVKAMTIIITSVFYVVTYYSFPPLLGWPTTQHPPSQFRLISAHVVQPNKETGKEGSVYLWLTEIKNMSDSAEPRAYELQYSSELHERIINVKSKLDKDIKQMGEFKEPDDTFNQVDEQKRGMKSVHIEFYDLPDPLFQDKG
ncbi:MAG TPA: hypothetical protein EYQ42_01045 [Thiotrichaceae bacterium]|nr:hypothetical protein [Thiotrichaceae bacterium]HIM07981.1 hypothetical protein [Gammaproteobacteria bacterium]